MDFKTTRSRNRFNYDNVDDGDHDDGDHNDEIHHVCKAISESDKQRNDDRIRMGDKKVAMRYTNKLQYANLPSATRCQTWPLSFPPHSCQSMDRFINACRERSANCQFFTPL